MEESNEIVVDGGGKSIAEPRRAPWSKVARVQDPGGMQITLFEKSTLFE